MPDIADKILPLPTKSPIEVEAKLRELKGYDCLAKAPWQLLAHISEHLDENKVLALWVLKGPALRLLMYSIEDRSAAISANDEHKRNYHGNNPVVVRWHSQDELSKYFQ